MSRGLLAAEGLRDDGQIIMGIKCLQLLILLLEPARKPELSGFGFPPVYGETRLSFGFVFLID